MSASNFVTDSKSTDSMKPKGINKTVYAFQFEGLPLEEIRKGRKGSELEISLVKDYKEQNLVFNIKENMPQLRSANISAEVFRQMSGSDRTIREFIDQYDVAYARALQATTMFVGTDATVEEVALAEAGLHALAKARKERAAAELLIHQEFSKKVDDLAINYANILKNQNAYVIIAGSTFDNVPFMDKVALLAITDSESRKTGTNDILATWKQELLDYARANNGALDRSRIVL